MTAFLLVEHHGPWGQAVLRDSRLSEPVRRHLSTHGNLKVLLARRHHRAHRGTQFRLFLCFPGRQLLLTTKVEDHAELTGLDLAAISRGEAPDWPRVAGPIFGVCTHGRHDACCAERGRPVAAALSASHPEATWEVSHVGGDRFAANMLVLPEGLYYGRMDAGTAPQVADLHEQGRVDLARLRGCSAYPMSVQYAEVSLRRHLEEDRLDAFRLVRRNGATSVFARDGEQWAVTVSRTPGEPARLTCGAAGLNPVPVFDVVALRRV